MFFFRADRKTKMAAPASDWLRHFRLLLRNCWTEFSKTWHKARTQRPLPSLCFSVWSEKQNGRPGVWLAETFSTSLKPLKGIRGNLSVSKNSTSSVMLWGPIEKTIWSPPPLIGWDIFDIFSETTERNLRKLDRKREHNIIYQVCVFRQIIIRITIVFLSKSVTHVHDCGPLGLWFVFDLLVGFFFFFDYPPPPPEDNHPGWSVNKDEVLQSRFCTQPLTR